MWHQFTLLTSIEGIINHLFTRRQPHPHHSLLYALVRSSFHPRQSHHPLLFRSFTSRWKCNSSNTPRTWIAFTDYSAVSALFVLIGLFFNLLFGQLLFRSVRKTNLAIRVSFHRTLIIDPITYTVYVYNLMYELLLKALGVQLHYILCFTLSHGGLLWHSISECRSQNVYFWIQVHRVPVREFRRHEDR